jgi:hypothetical protein
MVHSSCPLSQCHGCRAAPPPPPLHVLRSAAGDPAGTDVLLGDLRGMHFAMSFSSVLLGHSVTPYALSTLCEEILAARGPLPVGEIGKTLQDSLGNQRLSAMVKERFGGLKKFFEEAADVFFVGQDHVFNPRVCLQSQVPACAACRAGGVCVGVGWGGCAGLPPPPCLCYLIWAMQCLARLFYGSLRAAGVMGCARACVCVWWN